MYDANDFIMNVP